MAKKTSMKKASKKFKQELIKLSYGMSGKMEDILSMSTNCIHCKRCLLRHGIKGTICAYCYAFKQLEKPNYKNTNMIKAFNHNADILANRFLTETESKAVAREVVNALMKNGTHFFRIESFGDLHNEIHAMNYINICSAIDFVAFEENYSVNIGFWSKNFDYLCNAFSKCDEFTKNAFRHSTSVVLSSVFVGLKISDKVVEKVESILGMSVKTFTVYASDNGNINCGAKHCAGCGNCYIKNNGIKDMNELLK